MRDFQLPGRSPVYGTQGVAATSHPLATLTAIEMLKAGGNAVDGAIAACAVQGVVEPQSTGIGGDCFALYVPAGSQQPIAFNGAGRTPAAATVDWFGDRGITKIEQHSPHAVTVPGAVDAWSRLLADYGRKSLGDVLQPAQRLAAEGYPIYPRVANDWHAAAPTLRQDETARRIFLPQGRSPQPGEIHRQPELAATLAAIAEQGRDAFYKGAIAKDIVDYLQRLGGLHTLEDFAAAQGEYVTPIATTYRGYEVYECPPSGQGLVALLMLNILEGYDLKAFPAMSVERFHLMAEAARLAYRDRDLYIADPKPHPLPIQEILSEAYAEQLRRTICLERAMADLPLPAFPCHPSTVYLCVVDGEGNAMSLINSTYHSFGSGLVSPQTGVVLHSRGAGFRIDPGHFNCIAPRKQPLHTIIPGMLMQKGRAVLPFGVMGGDFQPAGHVHLLTNLLDYGMDVQTALDFPRVFSYQNVCHVEHGITPRVAEGLASLGHCVQPAYEPLGGGQAIWIDWETGVRVGGSDPRKDGCAIAC
ncbi:MAG: gamma-glutamyltransferase [Synechococcales bacterium]|nr:gamma-glutamyltransferase [Synechococcales bacterium]